MKIIFHENQLCYRGTSNALFDYAYYNEEMLGNESMILYPKNSPNNAEEAIERFKKRFNVVGYSDIKERDEIIKKANADLFYAIKSGERETDTLMSLLKRLFMRFLNTTNPMEMFMPMFLNGWPKR